MNNFHIHNYFNGKTPLPLYLKQTGNKLLIKSKDVLTNKVTAYTYSYEDNSVRTWYLYKRG